MNLLLILFLIFMKEKGERRKGKGERGKGKGKVEKPPPPTMKPSYLASKDINLPKKRTSIKHDDGISENQTIKNHLGTLPRYLVK